MPKKGHSEEQILRALRQAEAGTRVSEICREHGISDATFYIWKKSTRVWTADPRNAISGRPRAFRNTILVSQSCLFRVFDSALIPASSHVRGVDGAAHSLG